MAGGFGYGARMKILTDFDGVITDQTEEGLLERRLFRDEMVRASGQSSADVDALLARVESEVDAHPSRYGWEHHGRISAYADEDLFVRVIGLAGCLDGWADQGDPAAATVREGLVREGYERFTRLSDWAYGAMVEHTRAGAIEPLDPRVGAVFEALLARGDDVVVVSNSSTTRVMELLSTLDVKPVAHAEDPTARFRVRGDARKFALDPEPESFEANGLSFDVARSAYRTIITEEKPAAVIGDVFSLDLALPLYLTRTDPTTFGGLQVLLRTRDYTPAWAKTLCAEATGEARLGLLGDFVDLPAVTGG